MIFISSDIIKSKNNYNYKTVNQNFYLKCHILCNIHVINKNNYQLHDKHDGISDVIISKTLHKLNRISHVFNI